MPTAPVDSKGSVLYYEDSGAPAGSADYVTLVLVHGTCFHGAVYRPMIPFAVANNLRLVLLNMRGYPGCTPYSEEELEGLEGNPEAQSAAVQSRGAEFAEFIRWFIETSNIPPKREVPGCDKLVGGLSLLSWSGGNGPAISMFAHADKLPDNTKDLLDAYLRSFVLHDASSSAVGSAPPPNMRNVFMDSTPPVDVQAEKFALQVGSFYPPFPLPLPSTLDALKAHPSRPALQDSLDPSAVDAKYTPSVHPPKMSQEQLRNMTHPEILRRAQHAIWSPQVAREFSANVARAFYNNAAGVWPTVKVHAVWCRMTFGEGVWAAATLNSGYLQADEKTRRPMEFHVLEGANHFVHWEEPERFVKFLVEII